jgi:plastocyanin
VRRAAAPTVVAWAVLAAPAADGHPGHAPPTVSIAVYAYAPETVDVVEGDIVQWVWNGPDTNHSVTSDASSKEVFDSDKGVKPSAVGHPTGDTFTYYFAKAGTYTYHCKVHASMHGTVVVAPGVQYDQTPPVLAGARLVSVGRRAVVAFTVSEDASITAQLRRRGSSRVLRHSFRFVKAGKARTQVRVAGHGRYTVSLVAQDAAGNDSAVARVRVER